MRTLLEELRLIEDQALDFEQLSHILANRVTGLRVKYTDLSSLNNRYQLHDILPKHVNASLTLVSARITTKVQRHWVCFMRHKNGKISYYDSLNLGPSTLSSYMHDSGYFSRFIRQIRADVNHRKHQKDASMIKTCGLHCCVRLVSFATQDTSNSQYDHWIASMRMAPDMIVAILTFIGHISI